MSKHVHVAHMVPAVLDIDLGKGKVAASFRRLHPEPAATDLHFWDATIMHVSCLPSVWSDLTNVQFTQESYVLIKRLYASGGVEILLGITLGDKTCNNI